MRAADHERYPTPGCPLKPRRIYGVRPPSRPRRRVGRWRGHGRRRATIDGDSEVLAGAFRLLAVRTCLRDLAAGAWMIATYTERMTVPPMSDPSRGPAPAPAGAKPATAPAAALPQPSRTDQAVIRNFCIIAHIDHGKSTLADRMLQLTGVVGDRQKRAHYLARMDLDRQSGIPIKSQTFRRPLAGT